MQIKPKGAGLHRPPPCLALAARRAVIYALICECLFLPGDRMGPCLHIIFAFAFPSLPTPIPIPHKMVFIFIKAIYS